MIDDSIFIPRLISIIFLPIYNLQTFESSDDIYICIKSYHAIDKGKEKENKEFEQKEEE